LISVIFSSATHRFKMSDGKRPNTAIADVSDSIEQASQRSRTTASQVSTPMATMADPVSDASTYDYDRPLPPLPVVDVQNAMTGFGRGFRSTRLYAPPGYYADPARVQAAREVAMDEYNRLPANDKPLFTVRVNNVTGTATLARKPLPVLMDPVVVELGDRLAKTKEKIDALKPILTPTQRIVIDKMIRRATFYTKGKKTDQPKNPSVKDMDKVLFRAYEFFSARRAAQFGIQSRRAQKMRHDLVNKGRVITLTNGQRVGTNKRYAKKIASHAIINDAIAEAKGKAAAERALRTARNKMQRVNVALATGRKVSPKDLPPGTTVQRSRFQDMPPGFQVGPGVQQLPVEQ